VLPFSNPHKLPLGNDGQEIPGGKGKRRNPCIKISRDNGKTWPVNKTLEAEPSAYSDLSVLPDGTVICLYERGTSTACARFNLEWITQP
jgi:sialidase-1